MEKRESNYEIMKRQYASSEVKPVNSFSSLHSSTVASGSLFDRTSQCFDHRDAELSAACKRLGGVPFGKGDVSYVFPVFRDLKVAFH